MSQNHSKKNSSKKDPFEQQLFTRIPPEIVATFTNAQLTELKKVFNDRIYKRHFVDIRVSIPFFVKRFYVVFLLGKEKRFKKRE
ncbi:MAG: hypothetical protein HWQ43_25680 [Nostoc sp. JL31]|uniref:hypothetical protein n=1 Tax=Nostoc sp. JL31 TaxID=2815395 RepID=UPI0025EF59BA|nr:hypothetical protein [Nostoc sp. JL31]MBN3892389.1 hypothetical protein [Nostoc sp. JL31]